MVTLFQSFTLTVREKEHRVKRTKWNEQFQLARQGRRLAISAARAEEKIDEADSKSSLQALTVLYYNISTRFGNVNP